MAIKELYNGTIRDMSAEDEVIITKDQADTPKSIRVQEIERTDALKASAKQKLINGEPLTEDEADTIVL
tara:strand:+ start:385 stop:591 length:207 start_codon:yes stop_codon:yes gene_type:complete